MFVLFAVSAGAVEMSIPSLSGEPGSAVTVFVNVDEAKGIVGGDITLSYDDAILTAKEVRGTELIESLTVVPNTDLKSEVKIALAGAIGIGEGSGAIFEIDFDVKPDAPAGSESDITIAEAIIYDESGNEISVTIVNGTFTVSGEVTTRNIAVTNAEVKAGESASVSINIDDISGIAGVDIRLAYDATLIVIDDVQPVDVLANISADVNKDVPGEINISMESAKHTKTGPGAMFEIQFTVKSDAGATTTEIKFASVGLYDESDKDISAETTDGLITIKEPTPLEYPRWDVNEDGVVDISDLVMVGKHFGEDYRQIVAMAKMTDTRLKTGRTAVVKIKANGKVDSRRILRIDIEAGKVFDLYGYQFDLIFDADVLKVIGITPGTMLADDGIQTYWTVDAIDNKSGKILGVTQIRKATPYGVSDKSETFGLLASIVFEVKDVQKNTLLNIIRVEMADSDAHKIASTFSELHLNWEPLLIPQNALLLQNYPNPFNPETWIPYHLAFDAEVTIRIYDVMGRIVRTIELGHKPAGIYADKMRAAYWDGRGNDGEAVVSGVYFYSIQAREFAATRRLVILK